VNHSSSVRPLLTMLGAFCLMLMVMALNPALTQAGAATIGDNSPIHGASALSGEVPGQTAPEANPTGQNCTYTQGYWKNHEENWPVTSLVVGNTTYTQAELLAIFNRSAGGDATYILAHQLIAAKLNIANGADPSSVSQAVASADTWLIAHPLGSKPKNPARAEGIALSVILDDFNNGRIGPGHCDSNPNPAPTATPQPPTATPEPPTATPEPSPTATVPPPPQNISGRVWQENRTPDGLRSDEEPAVAGVLVRLYDAGNNPLGSTTTNGDGAYSFNGLTTSSSGVTYYVEIDESNFASTGALFNLALTTQNAAGVSEDRDSDYPVAAPHRLEVVLMPGADATSIDAGVYVQAQSCTVGLDLYYVLDLSGSMDLGYGMDSQGNSITKLQAAAKAIQHTNQMIYSWNNGSRVGLLTFYGNAGGTQVSSFVDQNLELLTLNDPFDPGNTHYNNFQNILPQLGANGTTPTAAALEVAYRRLSDSWDSNHVPVIILITDGVPTVNGDNPLGPPNPFDYNGYSGYLFNDADVQGVTVRDGMGGFRSIADVRTSGMPYVFAGGVNLFAGDPVADAMDQANDAMMFGPPGLNIHGVAIQSQFSGDIFNDGLIEYVSAGVGNGIFADSENLNELTADLEAAVAQSSCD
jgi:hypothetical protein